MTMNIPTLPLVPRGEARTTMRSENGAAGFDVKTLMRSKLAVEHSALLEAETEEKPQRETSEELPADGGQAPTTELHQLLTQQQPQPETISQTVNLSLSSRLSPSPIPQWSFTPENPVSVQSGLQAPTEQLPSKGGGGPLVMQVPVATDTKAAIIKAPAISDGLPGMQQVDKLSSLPAPVPTSIRVADPERISGAAPKPGAIPLHSVTAISGQFAQSVKVLPPVGPTKQAPGKNEVAALTEVTPRLNVEPAVTTKFGNSSDKARLPSIADRPATQAMVQQTSATHVQAPGSEAAAFSASPERQIVEAIDDEVSTLGARLRAQTALPAENPASGKLPLLNQIKVELNPASLGAVRIEIAMSASGEVELNLITAKEATATMIASNREEVLGGLQSRAVEVRGFTVSTADMGSSTQTGSHPDGSAARFSGHGDGQQSRHLQNGRGDAYGSGSRQEATAEEGETLQQNMRNSGSGIYI